MGGVKKDGEFVKKRGGGGVGGCGGGGRGAGGGGGGGGVNELFTWGFIEIYWIYWFRLPSLIGDRLVLSTSLSLLVHSVTELDP